MANLLDIVSGSTVVEIRGTPIEVRGLNPEEIALVLSRFPSIRKLMETRKADDDLAPSMIRALPAVIAIATGFPGDQKHEDAAKRLPAGDQLTIFHAAFKETFGPKGLGSLTEMLADLGVVEVPRASVRSSKSPKS